MEVLYQLSYAGAEKRIGAGDELRTRDPQLGRLMLYQLSYSRTVTSYRAAPLGMPAISLKMVVEVGFEPT
jgi:hypothetical protein